MKHPPSGNALFLILIAVALFAALSYAVTTSGRGGGTVDKEQLLIDAAQMTEYGATLRQTVARMVLTGTQVSDLQFCSDPDGACGGPNFSLGTYCMSGGECVFAPEGGGTLAPSIMNDSFKPDTSPTLCKQQVFIDGIGTAADDTHIAMQITSLSLCEQINKGLTGSVDTPFMTSGKYLRLTGCTDGKVDCLADTCLGDPFLCVQFGPTVLTYYHVLVEE